MTWLTDIYRQHQMLATRTAASNALVELRARLGDLTVFINTLLESACAGRHARSGGAGLQCLSRLDTAYTDDIRRLIVSPGQPQFDDVYSSCTPFIDVDREIDILRNCDWVRGVDINEHCVEVTTADVKLHYDGAGYSLGSFKLQLARNKITGVLDGSRDALDALTISGPRTYESSGCDYYHPHVPFGTDSEPCLGVALTPFQRGVERGLLSDAFLVLWSFLNTYNHESPLCDIEAFADVCDTAAAAINVPALIGEQIYDCPSCGRSVPFRDKRESDGRFHCAKCDTQVGTERALGRAGDWQCFNCQSECPSTEQPALARRGVKVCSRCVAINVPASEVRVRYTAHWNADQLLDGTKSLSRLFELLRPSSFGVERFSHRVDEQPDIHVHNVSIEYAIARPPASALQMCSCGAQVERVQPCVFVPGAGVCARCDAEQLGISQAAYGQPNIISFVHGQLCSMVPTGVFDSISRLQRRGTSTLIQNLDKLTAAELATMLRSVRRTVLDISKRPPLGSATTYWVAWINSLAPRLDDGRPAVQLIEV